DDSALWTTVPLPKTVAETFPTALHHRHPGYQRPTPYEPAQYQPAQYHPAPPSYQPAYRSDPGYKPEPTRHRGVAGRVTLAVLVTAVLLIGAGVASGVVKISNFIALSKPGATNEAPPSATPEADQFVPAGWHSAIADPLQSTGRWYADSDVANASECTVDGRLTVTKQTSGT